MQDKPGVRHEIAPRSIVVILAALADVWLACQLWIVQLMLAMALILAGTFNPLIESMERRELGRVHALVLLFLALIAVAAGVLILTIPPLVGASAGVWNAP